MWMKLANFLLLMSQKVKWAKVERAATACARAIERGSDWLYNSATATGRSLRDYYQVEHIRLGDRANCLSFGRFRVVRFDRGAGYLVFAVFRYLGGSYIVMYRHGSFLMPLAEETPHWLVEPAAKRIEDRIHSAKQLVAAGEVIIGRKKFKAVELIERDLWDWKKIVWTGVLGLLWAIAAIWKIYMEVIVNEILGQM